MSLHIFTPIYNEMPWTPFFLRHLLDYDCPITIGEGSSQLIENKNYRSTDGSYELIWQFAKEWPDRVTLYHHNPKNRLPGRAGKARPKYLAKMSAWHRMKKGDWLLGLAPDNWYTPAGIKKLKEGFGNADKDHLTALTAMKVFVYRFDLTIRKPLKGLCGPWWAWWPCVYRKDPRIKLKCGDELPVWANGKGFTGSKMQRRAKSNPWKHILVLGDAVNFHYKGIKTGGNRMRRWAISNAYKRRWKTHPARSSLPYMAEYTGEHHPLVDLHPWRHTHDCREEKQTFDYREFLHLVTKNKTEV